MAEEHRYAVAEDVRLRPVPEARVCLAYARAQPALHRLNVTAWLLVSLSNGRSLQAIAADYRAAVGHADTPDSVVRVALDNLVAVGVLRRLAPRHTMEGQDVGHP